MKKNDNYDAAGRLIRFYTKQGKGVLVSRFYDVSKGKKIYRNHFIYQVKRDRKRYYFSLSGEKVEAAKQADDIASFLSVTTNTIEAAMAKFAPKKVQTPTPETYSPTVGDLIQTYRNVANHVTERTKHECAGALRRISGYILRLKPFPRGAKGQILETWREKVNSLNVANITPKELESFRGSLIKAAGSDEIKKGKAIVTANAYIRSAGCIFVPKMRPLYGDFKLPDPCPFKAVGQLEERPHRYISKVDIGAIVTAARLELQKDCPDEFLAFVLSLFAGLRRGEIDRLIWDQIDFENRHIWIRTTPYFKPKANNSENRVDCPDEVFEILRRFKPHSINPPFVLPGGDPEQKNSLSPNIPTPI